jgi:hypothetical protein
MKSEGVDEISVEGMPPYERGQFRCKVGKGVLGGDCFCVEIHDTEEIERVIRIRSNT